MRYPLVLRTTDIIISFQIIGYKEVCDPKIDYWNADNATLLMFAVNKENYNQTYSVLITLYTRR